MSKRLTPQELAGMGGKATAKKHGREFFAELGRKSHEAKMAKYGKAHYSKLGKLSAEKRKHTQEEKDKRPTIAKIFGID